MFLGQAVEEIRLVLGDIPRGADDAAPVFHGGADIVSGGETVENQSGFAGQVGQYAELHQTVAANAGVRGAPRQIFGAEIVDDRFFVGLGAVEHVIRDVEQPADGGGVCDIVFFAGAETGVAGSALIAAGLPDFHGDAGHFVSGLFQQSGGDGRIHPAGKTCGDFHNASILSMGSRARSISSGESSTRGERYSSASAMLSTVIFFIFGQWMSGATGMNSFSGFSFLIR